MKNWPIPQYRKPQCPPLTSHLVSLSLKLVLNINLLLLRWISFDHFYHHQNLIFVYVRANKNLFVLKPIMCEINSSRLMFLCSFVAVFCNKIHWKVETHVGENFFSQFRSSQDTIRMLSKLKYVREFCFYVSFNLDCQITCASPPPAVVFV